nr:baseplate J/gp47 family protein [Ktedonobacteraceae bacterium]
MPLQVPRIDDRTYQDILNEVRARIPSYNPEWTNFNESDPGMTLLELFAFLTESIIWRCNQIPERNRIAFLSLLGIPLQPTSSARGLVAFSNERGPLQTYSLPADVEVRAQVPFRTEKGLDVLPVETQLYYKRKSLDPIGENTAYYHQLANLYASRTADFMPVLYEAVQLTANDKDGVDLSQVVDNSLWIALLARSTDSPDEVRQAIVGQTINLGIVPVVTNASRSLKPRGETNVGPQLLYQIPNPPPLTSGSSPEEPRELVPQYLPLDANAPTDVLAEPGVVEISLPNDPQKLRTWTTQDPFALSMYDFPPSLEDSKLNDRLITWLRISAPMTPADNNSVTRMDTPSSLQVKLLWAGINAVCVTQKTYVRNELLPPGTGEPAQSATLAHIPVIDHSVKLTVTVNGVSERWQEIDDLLDAAAEVPKADSRLPPGTRSIQPGFAQTKVFTVNCESGEIQFGDGMHGKRLPAGATVRADYAYGQGIAGNVDVGAITSVSPIPGISVSFKVTNPVRTWGGAEAETVTEGEKQIARYLQHRDRLVTVADFQSITLRTPGVDIGRIEVIPTYNPDLAQIVPGAAPGAVTLMVIPKYDPDHPDAPQPDRIFLDVIADYLEPRRLVTTELFVVGPVYKPLWVSVGIQVVAGTAIAQVREAVKQTLAQFLSPLPDPNMPDALLDSQVALRTTPQHGKVQRGWPLSKPVMAQELLAVATRVEGVQLVRQVFIAEDVGPVTDQIEMNALELPRLAGMFVTIGDAADIDYVRGQGGPLVPPDSMPPFTPPFTPPTGMGPAPTAGGGSPALPPAPGFIPSPGQGVAVTSPAARAGSAQVPASKGPGTKPPTFAPVPPAPTAPTAPPVPEVPKECL